MENNTANLTLKLTQRIFGNLGAFAESEVGIREFPITKNLILSEQGKKKLYQIYSAKIQYENINVKFLQTKIDNEYYLILHEDDKKFLLYYDSKSSYILLNDNNSIVSTSIFTQLQLTSLIEFITEHGILLQSNPDHNDLYKDLVFFIEELDAGNL